MEMVRTQLKYDGQVISRSQEYLRVSWIVIDPYIKRAINIAIHMAVASQILVNDDIELCYATVTAVASGKLVQLDVRATCGWMGRELHVEMVTMEISDVEKRTLNGMESLRILRAAMEGRRRRMDSKTEKDAYRKFWLNEEKIMSTVFVIIVFILVILALSVFGIVASFLIKR